MQEMKEGEMVLKREVVFGLIKCQLGRTHLHAEVTTTNKTSNGESLDRHIDDYRI
jgi:hypothetical protein